MSSADDRGSARLVAAIVDRVRASHPAVSIKVTEERPQQHFTIADFTAPNADGAPLTLYASFDWSFTLESGRFFIYEEEPMVDEDEEARVALIVDAIRAIALDGLRRSRLDHIIGTGRDRVGPWND